MENLTRVKFTNLEKVLYPALGIRKVDVIKYYIQVAPQMLPFLKGRALVVTRYPDGIEGERFYGKDTPLGTPDWVRLYRYHSESADREINYIVCDNLDTLIWLANLAALEMHIPLARVDQPDHPDLILFDLDPQAPADIQVAGKVAKRINEKLHEHGLNGWVKTSGKRGLHIIAPLEGKVTFEETRAMSHAIGKDLAMETGVVSSEKGMKKAGTVYIDYPQNSHGRTVVCPYSLRATPQATVSTPLSWGELDGLNSLKLNIKTVHLREDPWKGFWEQFKL